jgi:hypothetical protein
VTLANQVKIFSSLFSETPSGYVPPLFNVSDTEFKFSAHFYGFNLAIKSTV